MSTFSQKSFAGGEISPSLYARADLVKYATGLRTCRNFTVMRHGGAENRPGSVFVCEVKDSTKAVAFIPFVFNSAQTYMLEFGDQYMRVIRDEAQVFSSTKTITGITAANPPVVTSAAHGLSNGEEVYISGVLGMTQINGRNYKIANVATNTFELKDMGGTNVNGTAFSSYTSGGTAQVVYEIATPYVEADLPTLKFAQSGDVITIAHPNYAPRQLSRSGHASWSLSTITFAPSISAPTGQSASQGGSTGSTSYNWKITAVQSETYEESLPSSAANISNGNATLSATNYVTVSWSAVSGAVQYNIYRSYNGVYGFIGVADGTSFTDVGGIPDVTDTPPITRNPFNSSGDYPSTVNYIQQRLVFSNTDNDPEKTWMSKSGQYNNFTIRAPLQDDDAVTFTIAGKQVNEIHNVVDLGSPLLLTAGGEWAAQGDASGVITPSAINLKQYSYNGSSEVSPIIVGSNALYIQSRGTIVRDLAFDYQVDGYRGNDLTIHSGHLFDKYSIENWTYQQVPHSVVWAVRDDGVLLGMTYVREQQIIGWHRHDFQDGIVENVASIPNGNIDTPYVVVKRTINGRTTRYIEYLSDRRVNSVMDNIFMDSALSYDGRNTGSQSMTLSGSGWTYTDTLTLTSSTSYFSASEVGNEIHLTGSDGTIIRAEITAYSSATVVSVKPNKTVPVAMRSVAITNWARAVDVLRGLWHLEGEDVSIFADSFVVGSPNNEAYTVYTVTNGAVTLDRPYSVIHVGLPYISDLETLDIETTNSETLSDKKKLVGKVTMMVEETRGLFAGAKPPSDDDTDPLEGLYELKIRENEGYDSAVDLATESVEIKIKPEWNSNGRVFIRQVDPLPASILSINPAGLFPVRGG